MTTTQRSFAGRRDYPGREPASPTNFFIREKRAYSSNIESNNSLLEDKK